MYIMDNMYIIYVFHILHIKYKSYVIYTLYTYNNDIYYSESPNFCCCC